MPAPVGARNTIVFAIGVIMMALGAYFGSYLWSTGATATGSRVFDIVLTVFFLLRGWMNVRSATGRPLFGGARR